MDATHYTTEFDSQLMGAQIYRAYPELLPFVGREYKSTYRRILLIAESHYLPPGIQVIPSTNWYGGTSKELSSAVTGFINTRQIVSIGKNQRWQRSPLRMFGNIEEEMIRGGIPKAENSFTSVAFMNAFQRPAAYGASMRLIHDDTDVSIAKSTIAHVAQVLAPSRIFVLSSFAWSKVRAEVESAVDFSGNSSHALCVWWHRASRGGVKNRDIFQQFVRDALATDS